MVEVQDIKTYLEPPGQPISSTTSSVQGDDILLPPASLQN